MPSTWDPPLSPLRGSFATTHWSLVLAASGAGDGAHDAAEARAALEQLCRIYWPPIYAFVRRKGHQPDDARQLTQEFFTRLLERRDIDDADPDRGRFRSWLLGALQNFLANDWRQRTAKKRDEHKLVWLDGLDVEQSYRLEPRYHSDPELEYERDCAVALLERAFQRLQSECEARGKGWLFEHVRQAVLHGPDDGGYAALARSLGQTEGSLKVTVSRWRKRWVELVREQLAASLDLDAATAPHSDVIQAELDCLLASLSPARPT